MNTLDISYEYSYTPLLCVRVLLCDRQRIVPCTCCFFATCKSSPEHSTDRCTTSSGIDRKWPPARQKEYPHGKMMFQRCTGLINDPATRTKLSSGRSCSWRWHRHRRRFACPACPPRHLDGERRPSPSLSSIRCVRVGVGFQGSGARRQKCVGVWNMACTPNYSSKTC